MSTGILVRDAQLVNVLLKFVTAVLYRNKSVGMLVNPLVENACSNVVIAVFSLKRSPGILVKESHDAKIP